MEKRNRSVTIIDVAKKADVSIATVSHVINQTRYVGDELTQRVNQTIKELGYYPNRLVGSLRNKKTHTIGLILPSISNETFAIFTETVEKILFSSGYNLIICSTSQDSILEEASFNTMLTKKMDAIIAIPTSSNVEKMREIQSMGIPLVIVDRVIDGFDVDTVRVDNFKGSYDVVKYLISLGHRSIGYIDRNVELSHSLEQRRGYIKALEDNGVTPKPENIIRADGSDYKSGIRAAQTLVRQAQDITAIYAYYDIVAFGAMRGIYDLGYKIPEDISIIGYDGMPFTEASYPRLTTVSVPVDQLASETCKLLMKRIEEKHLKGNQDKPESKTEDIIIQPSLIVRDSAVRPK